MGAARRLGRGGGLPYWLILPTVAYLAGFFAWPTVPAFGLAFRDGDAWTLEHFRTMANDAAFGDALRFTLLLVVVIVPLQFVVALGMALLVNAKLRARGLFLYVFLLPLAISDLAAGIVWSAIFTEFGYLNTILEGLGVIDRPYLWLDPQNQGLLLMTVVTAVTDAGETVLAEEAWRCKTSYFDDSVAAAYAVLILVLSVGSAGLILRLLRTPREQM